MDVKCECRKLALDKQPRVELTARFTFHYWFLTTRSWLLEIYTPQKSPAEMQIVKCCPNQYA